MDIFEKLAEISNYNFLGSSVYKYIIFVIVLVLTFILRKLLVKPVVRYLNNSVSKLGSQIGDQLVARLELPVHFLFILMGIWISIEILLPPGEAKTFFEHLLRSLLVFLTFWALFRSCEPFIQVLQKISARAGIDLNNMMLTFIKNGTKGIIAAFGAISIMQEWGYNAAGLLAGLGLGGLAIALAVKDTLANFFSSLMIMLDKPFDVGDWIMTPHVEGTVEEVGFRSTRVRTFAQALVTIPNSMMSSEPVTNWSRMGKRRISFRLGISYNTKLSDIRSCVSRMREMLDSHPEVHPETILVYFERFSESSLEIFIYLFTNTVSWQKFLEVQEDINFRIMQILEELGVSIAFPSRTVYIENGEKN